MTKRDLILLSIAPVILVAISMNLLWLSGKLQHGAERRLADYAVLQRAASNQLNGAPQSATRSAVILSGLALAGSESDEATAGLSVSLAALLILVALFQIITVARLFRKQPMLVMPAWADTAAGVPEMKLSARRGVQHPERVGGS
ncbi:MAG TPA: hypothetical protein VMH26_18565 [Burkholderiales bacterium]|nr:hypothetical protein [Burkholderiales bacterium]